MGKFNNYDHVFSPLKVGNMTLKNRIQFAPMVCCLTTIDGEVTAEFADFLEMQARTGAALVTIGATPMDRVTGIDEMGELDVTRDECIGGLRRIAEAAHRHGAKISVELVHAGRRAKPELLQIPWALAPSAIPVGEVLPGSPQYLDNVKEMDQQDIDGIIERYADVVDRLRRCNFDMAMIHGAHGNLVAQFLSPLTNKRTDKYGGSLENRTRFLLEALQAIRAKVGRKINLEIRLSATEMAEGGLTVEDTKRIIKLIQPYVDLVNVSRGMLIPDYDFYTMPPYYNPHCHNVKYAAEFKADPEITVPISVVGSITGIDEAEQILASGSSDMVAMARALLVDENILKNAWRNKACRTRPCLRCWQNCTEETSMGSPVRCAVNPVVGRESRYREIPESRVKKKAVVIGGGPAGMMAAQTLALRGHDVVLFEKEAKLGGRLRDISDLSFKGDLKRYLEWDERETLECGADVRLGTEATPEAVRAERPDVIFVAVGSDPVHMGIPGEELDNVLNVIEVDAKRAEAGKKVVVCGGGASGAECALELAQEGREVTLVDILPVDEFAKDMGFITRNHLDFLLRKNNVRRIGGARVVSFSKNGVTVEIGGETRFIESDNAVAAFGMRARCAATAFAEITPEVYFIGDCDRAGNIHKANHDAFNRAVEV